jgi:phage shock protein A
MKIIQEELRKEKNAHESTKDQYEQQLNFMNETMQNLKSNNTELKEKLEDMTSCYDNVLTQKMEEEAIRRLEQLKEDHNK